jgi:hypothetical protein
MNIQMLSFITVKMISKFLFTSNRKFNTKATFLQNLKLSFPESSTVPVTFPSCIKENFLKIVSNIFYITAYRTWIDYKNSNLDSKKKSIDEIYQYNLKSVRKQVYAFFKITKNPDINTKYLVRLYPFSLLISDPIKSNYLKMSDDINVILDNLNKKIIPDLFLSDDSTIFEVRNVIILFII